MKKQRLFLIGGLDLEMQTIINLLHKRNIPYCNAVLHWHNALLSKYQTEIKRYGNRMEWELYGIELREDIPVPSNYSCIDHHNNRAHRPSSLEQVAALLHEPMDRYFQLVSANDAAYIPGMKSMGATPEEIAHIRLADRKAQGVTEEEERLAEISIAEGMHREGNLLLVHAQTSCFSPICDRLYPYDRLIIYTDKEITYYGSGVKALSVHFAKEIQAGRMYHGGGNAGYFGTSACAYSPSELKSLLIQFKKLTAL